MPKTRGARLREQAEGVEPSPPRSLPATTRRQKKIARRTRRASQSDQPAKAVAPATAERSQDRKNKVTAETGTDLIHTTSTALTRINIDRHVSTTKAKRKITENEDDIILPNGKRLRRANPKLRKELQKYSDAKQSRETTTKAKDTGAQSNVDNVPNITYKTGAQLNRSGMLLLNPDTRQSDLHDSGPDDECPQIALPPPRTISSVQPATVVTPSRSWGLTSLSGLYGSVKKVFTRPALSLQFDLSDSAHTARAEPEPLQGKSHDPHNAASSNDATAVTKSNNVHQLVDVTSTSPVATTPDNVLPSILSGSLDTSVASKLAASIPEPRLPSESESTKAQTNTTIEPATQQSKNSEDFWETRREEMKAEIERREVALRHAAIEQEIQRRLNEERYGLQPSRSIQASKRKRKSLVIRPPPGADYGIDIDCLIVSSSDEDSDDESTKSARPTKRVRFNFTSTTSSPVPDYYISTTPRQVNGDIRRPTPYTGREFAIPNLFESTNSITPSKSPQPKTEVANTNGSFGLDYDEFSDEEENTAAVPAPQSTPVPPPAPTPSHAVLPTTPATQDMAPAADAAFEPSVATPAGSAATVETPKSDALARARAQAMLFTPKTPSRLRESQQVSPSPLSEISANAQSFSTDGMSKSMNATKFSAFRPPAEHLAARQQANVNVEDEDDGAVHRALNSLTSEDFPGVEELAAEWTQHYEQILVDNRSKKANDPVSRALGRLTSEDFPGTQDFAKKMIAGAKAKLGIRD